MIGFDNTKEVILFGVGSLGLKVLQQLQNNDYKVVGIFDNDPNKHGTYVNEIPITKPEHITLADNQRIVIASSYSLEIQLQLKQQGIQYGIHYVNYNELFPYIEGGLPMKFSRKIDELSTIGEPWKYSIDEVGVLIKQDNRILRAVYKHSETKANAILSIMQKKDFYNHRIIDAIVTDYSTPNFPLILAHPFIPICSDSRSWPFTMKRQAMDFVAELFTDLHKEGLTLKDGHILNLTYVNHTFYWIDYGSLQLGTLSMPTLKEWIDSFVFPLILMRNLKSEEYRLQMGQEITPYFMIQSFLDEEGKVLMADIYSDVASQQDSYDALHAVHTWINKYLNDTSIYEETDWDSYRPLNMQISDDFKRKELAHKHTVIQTFLGKTTGNTLIDLAGNNGLYCIEAYQNHRYTGVLTDYDYQCIDNAYLHFQKEKIDFIPLVSDFNHFPDNLSFMGETKFDTALCLAFIHHLMFSNGFTFEKLRNKIVQVIRQHLIIEFVDCNDEYVSQWINPFFEWYNQTNFEQVFEEWFTIEDKQQISDSRTIYLMKLKSEQ
ncbi:hypothetical protein [Paenibacillus campi]|uniref:hypothetical protein n=1 Tax=Paenibacillus campi TaxID=3106031 RepID=UPI002AFFE149|nr:hypothetical protein [Paenibacillus sp. SGZ-1009]